MQNFEAADVARLDRAYSSPQIVDQRRRFRAAVAARPGEVGLDVGCGAGHLACELAREVTPGGRIVAIDKSGESVDASKARVAKEELADRVDMRVGDATAPVLSALPVTQLLSTACLRQMSVPGNKTSARVRRKVIGFFCLDRFVFTGTK